jgi:hypothetical protein
MAEYKKYFCTGDERNPYARDSFSQQRQRFTDPMFAVLLSNTTQVIQSREKRALSDHITRANLNGGNPPRGL